MYLAGIYFEPAHAPLWAAVSGPNDIDCFRVIRLIDVGARGDWWAGWMRMKNAVDGPANGIYLEHSAHLLIRVHEVIVWAMPNILDQKDALDLPGRASQQAAGLLRRKATDVLEHGLLMSDTQP